MYSTPCPPPAVDSRVHTCVSSRHMITWYRLVALWSISLIGCASSTVSDAGYGPGSSCVVDTDCPTGDRCLFARASTCSSTGFCYGPPPDRDRQCPAIAIYGCGCDGQTHGINICPYPDDLTPVRLAPDNRCTADAGTD